MRRILPAVLLGICLIVAGCAPVADVASTPTPTPSRSTTTATPSATPTPSGAGSATATPTPTPTRTQSVAPPPVAPPAEPGPEPEWEPAPQPTLGPDDADPADYVSYGIDTVNGGIPLPGVAFRTADGRTICGIFTWGHLSTDAGTATCTVDSYKEIYPQPFPDTGPFVMSVMVSPITGTSGLYPDWFAQPVREIPVLPDGKSMRYEGTVCTPTGTEVTCTVTSTAKGFVLSPTGYSYF